MKFQLSAVAAAILTSMLGMNEGSTSQEVEDKLLTDAAAKKNSTENDGTASKSEVEKFASEIAALKASNSKLESELATAQAAGESTTNAEAVTKLAAAEKLNAEQATEIEALKASNLKLKNAPVEETAGDINPKSTTKSEDTYVNPMTAKAKAMVEARQKK